MTTPALKADILQLPADGQPHNAWNGIPGSTDNVLFANNDNVNTWSLGFRNNIAPGGSNTIPLLPNSTVTLSANRTIYAVAPTGTASLVVIPGGSAYFQTSTLSGLGGVKIFNQATAPTQPPTIPVNSLWFNSTNNSLQQWNGAAWVVQAFAGSQLIQAGTIIASLIAAGTIVAGIVNGTEIDGAIFKLLNSFGAVDLLLDSGTDALFLYADTGSAVQGSLLSSLAARAVNDPIDATAVPQGLFSQQITLANQGATPAAIANTSILFSSPLGRLRCINGAGVVTSLQRADVNVGTQFVGNVTSFTAASAAFSYFGGEANQSAEFELEIDGLISTPAASVQVPSFALFIDGVNTGAQVGIGAAFLAASKTYCYSIRFRLSVVTTGAPGTCNVFIDGGVMQKGANAGNSQVDANVNRGDVGLSFDTTINHTFQVFAAFAALSTGQSLITEESRFKRRSLWLLAIP